MTLQERVHGQPKPIGWQTDKLHRVFRVRRSIKNTGMKEDNLLSLSYGRIIQKDIQTADGLLPENFEGYQIVESGNIVLRLTDLQNDKRSLRQGLVTQRGIITSAYDAVEVQRDNDARFWFYSLLALDLAKHYYSLGGGVRQSVKFADFPNDWIYRPDLSTQREIADFLDRETARIDLLIEKKQKLVALLGEKFETETTRLMTRGVRGDVTEFAKSIYHWAPDVPSHWTQTPLRQLLRLASGSVGEKSGDYVLLSLTKKGVIPRDVESGKGKFPSDFSAYQVVKPNQLVLCLFDIDETPRTVGLSNEHGMVTGAYTVADINADRVDHYFIYFHLLYIDNGKRLRPFYTGLRKVVRPQTFLNIRIPLPPMDEQKQIVQELQHWERRAKSISEKTNASIDRLKEYRSALITAAVTGQIDVSTYAKSGANDRRLDAIEEVFE